MVYAISVFLFSPAFLQLSTSLCVCVNFVSCSTGFLWFYIFLSCRYTSLSRTTWKKTNLTCTIVWLNYAGIVLASDPYTYPVHYYIALSIRHLLPETHLTSPTCWHQRSKRDTRSSLKVNILDILKTCKSVLIWNNNIRTKTKLGHYCFNCWYCF